ncbi:MAG: hypothetical protein KTR30_36040 [Saprospiraceae bacterium]|nr:hypothetical protein [Saprospiraceae bacterium]
MWVYQVKFLTLSVALVLGQVLFGQPTRTISGTVQIDGEPLIGQSILEHGTLNGTITQLEGKFELTIPSGKTVLLHFSQCFDQGYLLITPDVDYVEVKMNKKFFRKSKRDFKRWKRIKSSPTVAGNRPKTLFDALCLS